MLEIESPTPIPEHLIGQVQSKLAYVDEAIAAARVAKGGKSIHLTVRETLDPSHQHAIREKVLKVVDTMVEGALQPRSHVLANHLAREIPHREDPFPRLREMGEVVEEGTGTVTLGPLLTGLIELFESQVEGVAAEFGARPHRFPALISAELLDKVDYFRSFPHSLTFVTHLREDLEVIEDFSNSAEVDGGLLAIQEGALSGVEALLSPAVCFHYYWALRGQQLQDGRYATAVGNCFRYESSNLASLERLWNFTMREIIFVGSKDFVLQNRERARERVEPLLDRWGLAYKVESANDPFFVGEFKKQAAFQSAFQLKFEIQARLPHREGLLAIGSYNYHQDFFGRRLDISLTDGSPAHTGCVAFGLERVVFAFISQYGLDPEGWPPMVRESMQ